MRTQVIHKDRAGRIMVPRQVNKIMKSCYQPSATPTTDVGFYHRHRIEGINEYRFNEAMDEFTAYMNRISGFVFIEAFDGPHQFAADVLYAIDGPLPAGAINGAHSHNAIRFMYQ